MHDEGLANNSVSKFLESLVRSCACNLQVSLLRFLFLTSISSRASHQDDSSLICLQRSLHPHYGNPTEGPLGIVVVFYSNVTVQGFSKAGLDIRAGVGDDVRSLHVRPQPPFARWQEEVAFAALLNVAGLLLISSSSLPSRPLLALTYEHLMSLEAVAFSLPNRVGSIILPEGIRAARSILGGNKAVFGYIGFQVLTTTISEPVIGSVLPF